MNANFSRKLKLLKIWEILQHKTDSENPITTQELIGELENYGIECERRTLYKDIELLRENGYEIVKGRLLHENTYYTEENKLSVPEIKIIMDAVQNASFIPQNKTDKLLDRLAGFSSCFREGLLKRTMMHFQTVKHTNNDIYKNVDVIEKALEKKCVITFRYFHINADKKKIYTEKSYSEEAVRTAIEDGNYYIMCYRPQKEYVNNLKIFRIDRMENIRITEEKICKEAVDAMYNSENYKLQSFKMYAGNIQNVTLRFDSSLVEVIYDKFGYDVQIYRSGEFLYVDTEVQISPAFWGWMMQFPVKMKIHKPESIRKAYNEWVSSALK